jgi:hypothetical protein
MGPWPAPWRQTCADHPTTAACGVALALVALAADAVTCDIVIDRNNTVVYQTSRRQSTFQAAPPRA